MCRELAKVLRANFNVTKGTFSDGAGGQGNIEVVGASKVFNCLQGTQESSRKLLFAVFFLGSSFSKAAVKKYFLLFLAALSVEHFKLLMKSYGE